MPTTILEARLAAKSRVEAAIADVKALGVHVDLAARPKKLPPEGVIFLDCDWGRGSIEGVSSGHLRVGAYGFIEAEICTVIGEGIGLSDRLAIAIGRAYLAAQDGDLCFGAPHDIGGARDGSFYHRRMDLHFRREQHFERS